MTYSVIFAPEAEEQLAQLYRYIAEHGTPDTAERYVSAIIAYCEACIVFLTGERAAMIFGRDFARRITKGRR